MRIIGAAIQIDDRVFFKPYPTGYANIARYIAKNGLDAKKGTKGFFTSDNTFVSPEAALVIVKETGQLVGTPRFRHKLSMEDTLIMSD